MDNNESGGDTFFIGNALSRNFWIDIKMDIVSETGFGLKKRMKKICFLITTRGNYAKTYSVLEALKDKVELQYIIGGGCPDMEFHGETAEISVREPIDKSAAIISEQASAHLKYFKPDVVVITGDRWECLPVAMVAFYQGIQIAHIEGGELSGNIDNRIRHAITQLSDFHFVSNQSAVLRIRMSAGNNFGNVFNVGATSLDALELFGNNLFFPRKSYIIIIYHPPGDAVKTIFDAVDGLDMRMIWIGPNIDMGSRLVDKSLSYIVLKNWLSKHVILKDLKIEQFAPLLKNAACIVGNSSTGIREASFLGVPAVNIGDRQRNRLRGENVLDVSRETMVIKDAILKQIEHGPYQPSHIYGFGGSGAKIANILLTRDFEVQKTFYDLGNNTGAGRQSRTEGKKHGTVGRQTAVSMGP